MTADRGENRYGRGPGGAPQAEIIGAAPGGAPVPRLAVAVARAGGLGVLDLGPDRASGLAALDEVVRWWPGPFGVRVPVGCRVRPDELPDAVSTVLVDAPAFGDDDAPVDVAGFARGRRLLVEVVDPAEAAAALDAARGVAGTRGVGLIARGCEAGGRAGELTTFVLLQHLLGLDVPVHAAGGIGPRTAAAAVAGGAAGVVLDAQLALVAEMDAPAGEAPGGQDGPLAGTLAARYKTAGGVVQAVRRGIAEHVRAAVRVAPLAPQDGPHGREYPVVQGPMTQVSDSSAFAAAVAQDGGLPFLALGAMDGDRVRELLRDTADRLAGRPWGVGMVGFVPPELRAEQLAAVRAAAPPYALIAGGLPVQAEQLEEAGTRTYLNVPAPEQLDRFLAEGARRFVFEGMECGGHVGPRASFPLWEAQLDRLDAFCDAHPDEAARLSVMFAGGIHDERSAAMVAALAGPLAERGADVRVLMGTAYLFTPEAVAAGAVRPGYQQTALECTATALLETSPGHATRCADTPYVRTFAETRAELLGTGMSQHEAFRRLEKLNLGRLRIASKGVRRGAPVDTDEQRAEGLYLIGQVATLRSARTGVAALHEQVTSGATGLLTARAAELGLDGRDVASRPADIAIIGMDCVLPGARDAGEYWANVLAGADAVTEVAHWDQDAHEGPIPSRRGGFLPDVPFDADAHGVPAAALGAIDPAHLLSLEVAARALDDAGYGDRAFDRDRTSVIFGAEDGGDLAAAYALRAALPAYFGEVPPELDERLPAPTADSITGVRAAALAARFGLGGVAHTVAAGAASSLAALDAACRELATGGSDMVLCGGADLRTGVHDYLRAAAAGTLSPSGRCAPFDAAADGIAPGEGVACVVLKRLADAERDGDRIYAVVRAVAGAAAGGDGADGRERALRRAYRRAGVAPERVGLVETSDTGGGAELDAYASAFAGAAPGAVALGSVTSQIGHTGAAAGLAGLIKTAHALHTGALPGTLHLARPDEAWDAGGPLAFGTSARPWAVPPGDRHAGVAGSGLGGAHYHAVLSGYGGAPEPVSGRAEWPAELFVIRAGTDVERLRALAASGHRLRDLARTVASDEGPVLAAFAATGPDDLRARLARLDGPADRDPGQVAFLFPGLAAPPGALADLFVAFPRLQRLLRLGRDYVPAMFPPAAFTAEDVRRRDAALADPRAAQPALGLAGLAVHRLLTAVGVHPDLAAGHGHGEVVALCAAGVFDDADLIELSAARADAILAAAGDDPGAMAVVTGGLREVRDALSEVSDISVAAHNAPREVVIAGTSAGVDRALGVLTERGLPAELLPGARALHSPLVAAASGDLRAALTGRDLRSPAFPVWSGATAAPYDTDPADLAATLAGQLAAPVRFAEQIEAMYAAGARTFVEAGPGGVLTGLVGAVLGDRPHTAVGCDGLHGLLDALAGLAAAGVPVDPLPLFAGRDARPVDAPAPAPAWFVNGHLVTTADGGTPPNGLRPAARVGRPRRSDAAVLEYLRAGRELIAAQREVILRHLAEAPAAPVPAPRPILPGETLPDGPADARTAARAAVLRDLAARTGHPEALLADDLDLETDLAIDTGERTALLRDLAARAGVPAPAEPSGVRTIGELVDWLDGLPDPAPAPTAHVGTSALSGGPTPPSPRPPADPAGRTPGGPGRSRDDEARDAERTRPDGLALGDLSKERELVPDGAGRVAGEADRPGGDAPDASAVGEPEVSRGFASDGAGPEEIRSDASGPDREFVPCEAGPVASECGAGEVDWPDASVGREPEEAWGVASDGGGPEEPRSGAETPPSPAVGDPELGADGAGRDGRVAFSLGEPQGDPAPRRGDDARGAGDGGDGEYVRVIPPGERSRGDGDASAEGRPSRTRRAERASVEDGASARGDETVRVIPPGERPRVRGAASGEVDDLVRESVRVIPPGERSGRGARADGGAVPAERAGVRVIPPAEHPGRGHAAPDVVVAGAGLDGGDGESVRVIAPHSGTAEASGAEAEPVAEAAPVIVRHVLRDTDLDPLPLPADSGTAFAGRRFIVVDDGCGVAFELADVLGRYGAQVRTPLEVDGPCDGLVHLGALRPAGTAVLPEAYAGVRRALLGGLRWFVAVGGAGGASGRRFGGGAGEPGPGAGLRGLARTVAREFPETMVRAVDVDTGETPRVIALRIMAELLAANAPVTVGYEGERRRTPALVRMELDGDAAVPMGSDGVVLLTGGARGVPARVARGLAATTGCHLEIVGRTPEPVGRTVFSEAVDEAALRRVLVAEGSRGPEEIEETIRRILAEREVQENLDALRLRAASVRYHAGDVRDARFVRRVVEDVYERHGRLDGLLHGAGIAEDRLVRDKSPESFERAYRTKVDGASALAAAVRPDIGFFVVLGAAAGERLPADRAAADDACDALARGWRARLRGRVLVADLAPPLDGEPGVAALFREIAHGDEARVVFTGPDR